MKIIIDIEEQPTGQLSIKWRADGVVTAKERTATLAIGEALRVTCEELMQGQGRVTIIDRPLSNG